MPEPVFEIVDINTLTPRKDNPNELTDEQMKSLDYAIDRFGFLETIYSQERPPQIPVCGSKIRVETDGLAALDYCLIVLADQIMSD